MDRTSSHASKKKSDAIRPLVSGSPMTATKPRKRSPECLPRCPLLELSCSTDAKNITAMPARADRNAKVHRKTLNARAIRVPKRGLRKAGSFPFSFCVSSAIVTKIANNGPMEKLAQDVRG